MTLMYSRSITKVDIPEPSGLSGKFIYNFFVADEMTNFDNPMADYYHGAVSAAKLKSLLTGSVTMANAQSPRFIALRWNPTSTGKLQTDHKDAIQALSPRNWNLEQNVTRAGEVFYSFRDPHMTVRNRRLLERLLSVYTENLEGVDKLALVGEIIPKVDQQKVASILSPTREKGITYVNNVGKEPENLVFFKASTFTTTAVMDRRTWSMSLSTYKNRVNPEHASMQEHAKSSDAATVNENILSEQPINFKIFDMEIKEGPTETPKSTTVGYVIDRTHQQVSPEPAVNKPELITKTYIVLGGDVSDFIDARIAYGYEYTYKIRTISLVEMEIPMPPQYVPGVDAPFILPGMKYRCNVSVVSDYSEPIVITAQELIPPEAPDGFVLKFDYSNNEGLHLFWQFPVGRQRDVKYFQVFRRKSIHDPFTCIAQIDFDDSKKRVSLSEYVRSESVIKVSKPVTHYRDPDFNRTNKGFIYAIAAVDAHGLTSGYSIQILADYDKRRNRLVLKRISQANAPKQYPNFFIDPDLDDNVLVDSFTQDAMRVSLKKNLKIYFDPDALTYSSNQANESAGEITPGNVVEFSNTGGQSTAPVYKLLLLNVDLQKSKVIELKVDDLRYKSDV